MPGSDSHLNYIRHLDKKEAKTAESNQRITKLDVCNFTNTQPDFNGETEEEDNKALETIDYKL